MVPGFDDRCFTELYIINCEMDSAAAEVFAGAGAWGHFGFMMPGPLSNISWKDRSTDGTDFTSLSGEKEPVKLYFIESICCRSIFATLTSAIASVSQLSANSCSAWLMSSSKANSVRFDGHFTSTRSGPAVAITC